MEDLVLQQTQDKSYTLYSNHYKAAYHSTHGALQESLHVFIKHGLLAFRDSNPNTKDINILEMGFGTGLNALLSYLHSGSDQPIFYHAIEKHPVPQRIVKQLNYKDLLDSWDQHNFEKIHACTWNQICELNHFRILKTEMDISDIVFVDKYHLVYYDAFGPRAQPHLWEKEILEKVTDVIHPAGIFVTYCSQGAFRRNLASLGMEVSKLPGPPGKREMVVARKRGNVES